MPARASPWRQEGIEVCELSCDAFEGRMDNMIKMFFFLE